MESFLALDSLNACRDIERGDAGIVEAMRRAALTVNLRMTQRSRLVRLGRSPAVR